MLYLCEKVAFNEMTGSQMLLEKEQSSLMRDDQVPIAIVAAAGL